MIAPIEFTAKHCALLPFDLLCLFLSEDISRLTGSINYSAMEEEEEKEEEEEEEEEALSFGPLDNLQKVQRRRGAGLE